MEWNGNEVTKLTEEGLTNSIIALALAVESEAVNLAPKDTGRLKGSITVESGLLSTPIRTPAESEDKIGKVNSKFEAEVGTNLEYAINLEFGTSRQRAQPFLRPAFDEIDRQKENIIKAQIAAKLKKFLE